MDGSIQNSFNALIIYSAIENGLNKNEVENVKILVSKMTDYEVNYIKENKKYAWLPKTKEIVKEISQTYNELSE